MLTQNGLLEIEFDDKTCFFTCTDEAFDYVCEYIEAYSNGDDDKEEKIIIDAINKGILSNKPVDYYRYDLETFDRIFAKHLSEISKSTYRGEQKMSHRFYLVSMPREVYLKIMPAKNLTELDTILKSLGYPKGHPHDEDDVLDYDEFAITEYEFGSNFWDEAEKIIADCEPTWCLSPLFHEDKGSAPHVVKEHTLKTIIDVIKEDIINYYKGRMLRIPSKNGNPNSVPTS